MPGTAPRPFGALEPDPLGGSGASVQVQHAHRFALGDLPGPAEAQGQVEVLGAVVAGVPGDVELARAPAVEFLGHRLHGEAAVTPALLLRRDVQPPQAGADDAAAVLVPVDVEEGH